MHKLQCFSKYDLLDLCSSCGFNYLQGRFHQIAPLIKSSFEHHCSNHTFHKCMLNNGIQYHNTIFFKILARNSSMNYNMSKQEQYASYINDHLLIVQNK
jgi:hypothetical protein